MALLSRKMTEFNRRGTSTASYPKITWYQIPATDGTTCFTIYVDSAKADDTGDGLTPATAKKTIAAGWALVGSNIGGSGVNLSRGDQMLLKRGATWTNEFLKDSGHARIDDGGNNHITKNGVSWNRPLVIGAYGSGARPKINYSTNSNGLFGTDPGDTNNFIVVDSIEIASAGSNTATCVGFSFLGITNNVLMQNCKATGFGCNFRIEGDDTHRHTHTYFKGNICCDANCAVAAGTNASQGVFFSDCDHIVCEFNLFDANAWSSSVDYTIYRHNVYVQDGCTGVIWRYNTATNGDGVQLKAGGECYQNVMSKCTVSLKYGVGDTPPAAGVNGLVAHNAFLENIDPPAGSGPTGPLSFDAMNPLRAGMALYLANLVGVSFSHNYFIGGVGTSARTIWWVAMDVGGGVHRSLQGCTFDSMISHNWGGQFLSLEADILYSTGNKMKRCVFQNTTATNKDPGLSPNYAVIDTFDNYANDDLALENCVLSPNPAVTNPAGAVLNVGSLATWFTQMGAVGCSTTAITYSAPDRSLGTYAGTVGLTATHAAYITAMRAQDRDVAWDDRYTAPAVVSYIAAGFS